MAGAMDRTAIMEGFAKLAVKAHGTESVSDGPSRPARGVWIETCFCWMADSAAAVTPRAGRVD